MGEGFHHHIFLFVGGPRVSSCSRLVVVVVRPEPEDPFLYVRG